MSDLALDEIRRLIDLLVSQRDRRRDEFAKVIGRAMAERIPASDADEVARKLLAYGIPRTLATQALEVAGQRGGFTIFSLVDALTRLPGQVQFAGDRLELDQKAASLLALAAHNKRSSSVTTCR